MNPHEHPLKVFSLKMCASIKAEYNNFVKENNIAELERIKPPYEAACELSDAITSNASEDIFDAALAEFEAAMDIYMQD